MRLNERVKALEKSQSPPKGLTIIRRFIAPGYLDAEIDHISDHDGNEWTRQHCETEQAFTERAESETTANPWGIKFLIAKTLELSHANH
jgi:hypothetical protein